MRVILCALALLYTVAVWDWSADAAANAPDFRAQRDEVLRTLDDPLAPAFRLTTCTTHHEEAVIYPEGNATLSVPKFNASSGTLLSVTVRGQLKFVPPTWYPGSEPNGAVFRMQDLSNDGNPATAHFNYDGPGHCPGAGETEGLPGGAWEKLRVQIGGVTLLATTIETGKVSVTDSWDPFGISTYELHARYEHGDESVVYTTDLDRWEGTGDWDFNMNTTYGNYGSCGSAGAQQQGWDAWVSLEVTYCYLEA